MQKYPPLFLIRNTNINGETVIAVFLSDLNLLLAKIATKALPELGKDQTPFFQHGFDVKITGCLSNTYL